MNPLLYRMDVTNKHQGAMLAAVLVMIVTVDFIGSLV